eukprot:461024-Alexandrium_andersonii.AAC.1
MANGRPPKDPRVALASPLRAVPSKFGRCEDAHERPRSARIVGGGGPETDPGRLPEAASGGT